MSRLLLAVVIAVVLVPRLAVAERRDWYGWQPMIPDGAAFLLGDLALDHESPGLGVAAFGVYGLSSPLIHVAHGNPGRGLASLGLRVGLPLLGALIGTTGGIGSTLKGERGVGAALSGFEVGGLIGIVAASVLDYAVLSRETTGSQPVPIMLSFGGSFR